MATDLPTREQFAELMNQDDPNWVERKVAPPLLAAYSAALTEINNLKELSRLDANIHATCHEERDAALTQIEDLERKNKREREARHVTEKLNRELHARLLQER